MYSVLITTDDNNVVLNLSSLGVQPQPVVQSFFASTKHLIYSFTVAVKLKCRSVTDVLSSFWTFINVCIDERNLRKIVTQPTECWKNLTAHTTPETNKEPNKPCRF